VTSQPEPNPGEGRTAAQFLRPLRDLAAYALVAATAVFLFVAIIRLIPGGVGETFASRTQESFYNFVSLPTIGFPLVAVLLALLIKPQHPKANLIVLAAAVEYAVAAFFGVIFGILVGLVQIAGLSVRTAFEELLVRVAWLGVFAVVAFAVYQIWRNLFYTPKPKPVSQPGMYGQPQYGVPGTYPGQPGYGQPGAPAQQWGQQPIPGAPGQPAWGQPGAPGQPAPGQPGYGQPGAPGQPAPSQPGYGQPGAPGQPAPSQPGYGQPTYGQPAYGQPSTAPAWGQPVVPGFPAQPVSAQPASAAPASAPPAPAAPASAPPAAPPGPYAPAPGYPSPATPTYGTPPSGQYGNPALPSDFSEATQAVPRYQPQEDDRTQIVGNERPGFGPADEDPPRH